MTKQPTRLSNFQIPREQAVAAAGGQDLTPAAEPAARPAFLQPEVRAALATSPPAARAAPTPVAPAAIAVELPAPPAPLPDLQVPLAVAPSLPPAVPRPVPRPEEEPRRQIGARVRASVAERLRTALFVTRESQQDAVEQALDDWLRARGF